MQYIMHQATFDDDSGASLDVESSILQQFWKDFVGGFEHLKVLYAS